MVTKAACFYDPGKQRSLIQSLNKKSSNAACTAQKTFASIVVGASPVHVPFWQRKAVNDVGVVLAAVADIFVGSAHLFVAKFLASPVR